MGVVNVHQYPIPEGLSGQQAVDNLIKVLEHLGAKKNGNFLVDCETYYSASSIQPSRVLNIIHNFDQPATCYALLDTGTSISVDNNFDVLMLSMSNFYQSKKSSKIECKGPKYVFGDFIVKIGSVSVGPFFKGILIEVEYGPCIIPKLCWDLVTEFMSTFMVCPKEPNLYLQNKMNDVFTPMDTTQQYCELFNILRKSGPNNPTNLPALNTFSSVTASN